MCKVGAGGTPVGGRAGFDEGDDDVADEHAQVLRGHAGQVVHQGRLPGRQQRSHLVEAGDLRRYRAQRLIQLLPHLQPVAHTTVNFLLHSHTTKYHDNSIRSPWCYAPFETNLGGL